MLKIVHICSVQSLYHKVGEVFWWNHAEQLSEGFWAVADF